MPTLNWLTRNEDVRAASRVPYRLLEEAPGLSAGDPHSENILLQGDNLEALKALRIGLDPCSMRRPISGVRVARENGMSRHAAGDPQPAHRV